MNVLLFTRRCSSPHFITRNVTTIDTICEMLLFYLESTIYRLYLIHSYRKAIIRLSNLVMDQPLHPVERAAWWMEYLLRHPSPKDSMRNPVLHLSWWQYFMIDILVVCGIVLVIILVLIKALVLFCCCRKNSKTKIE